MNQFTRDRYPAVSRVLSRVLVINLGIAGAKIAIGYATGAVSIISDGFHSLTDAASNVVGIVGIGAAGRPPDEDHPYGHRKYETVAAAAVTLFLVAVVLEVLRHAFNHLSGRSPAPDVTPLAFGVMSASAALQLGIVKYESGEARRLASELLAADATQARGDIWTSFTVIVALVGARLGIPLLDPIGALVVAGFIAYAGYQIARATTYILSDRSVMSEEAIERVVMSVPGIVGCHQIRTRGSEDHVFLDLHVWLPGDMKLTEAHGLSHTVKDRLMARYPQIVDAIIHIEPPPQDGQVGQVGRVGRG